MSHLCAFNSPTKVLKTCHAIKLLSSEPILHVLCPIACLSTDNWNAATSNQQAQKKAAISAQFTNIRIPPFLSAQNRPSRILGVRIPLADTHTPLIEPRSGGMCDPTKSTGQSRYISEHQPQTFSRVIAPLPHQLSLH